MQSNCFKSVKDFVGNNNPLEVFLKFGLSIVTSLYKWGGRVISWIFYPSGTAAKTNECSKKYFSTSPSISDSENTTPPADRPFEAKKEFFFSTCSPSPQEENPPKWRRRTSERCVRADNRILTTILNSLPSGKFKELLQKKSIEWVTIRNMTDPFIYMPNRPALQAIASNYLTKYGILIRETVAEDNLFMELIKEIEKTIEGPSYVGVIISQDSEDNEYTHCLPLIIYLKKKDPNTGSRAMQFLISDTTGVNNNMLLYQVCFNIHKFKNAEIYVTTERRQVDNHSCRTGAMLLLKRALLALQDSEHIGLDHFLTAHGCLDLSRRVDISIIRQDQGSLASSPIFFKYLPAQFDATEQITNKGGSLGEITDSRDRHSKQAQKKSKPRTVKELRQKHRHKVIFKYKFTVDLPFLEGDIEIPQNVTVMKGLEIATVIVTIEVEVNTHLVRKGAELSKKKHVNTYLVQKGRDQGNMQMKNGQFSPSIS